MEVVWNIYDKELGIKMKSAYENYFKLSLKNLQKSFPYREIYIKYLEENSIQV